MNKGKGIGIGVTVIAVAIVFGIASLPDEVLLESPKLDTSETLPTVMNPVDITPREVPIVEPIQEVVEEESIQEVIEIDLLEEVVEEEPLEEVIEEEPIQEVVEESETPDESEGKIITVTINDGVGARMK